jgi:tetratricopeptide (TPR) repeat protein
VGFFNKIKKSFELKQNSPTIESLEKTKKKILVLKKQFDLEPENSKILIELYACYVELSDLENKIQCLKKLLNILPLDFYPFQQLADIYLHELNDKDKAQIYQNKANELKNNF